MKIIVLLIVVTGFSSSCTVWKSISKEQNLDSLLPSMGVESDVYHRIDSLDYYIDLDDREQLPMGRVGKFNDVRLDSCKIYAVCSSHYLLMGQDDAGQRVTEIHHVDRSSNMFDIYVAFRYQIKQYEEKFLSGNPIVDEDCDYVHYVYRLEDGKLSSFWANLVLRIDDHKIPLYKVGDMHYRSVDEQLCDAYNTGFQICQKKLLYISKDLEIKFPPKNKASP